MCVIFGKENEIWDIMVGEIQLFAWYLYEQYQLMLIKFPLFILRRLILITDLLLAVDSQ